MIKIQRKRYVIIREGKDGPEIFCGLARNFIFKPIDKIGETAIKTYRSEQQAEATFNKSWRRDCAYCIVPISETIEEMEV